MTTSAADARFVLSSDLRVSMHNGGAVVLDVRQGHLFTANDVGARVLTLLGDGLTLDQIADRISAECSVSRERVRIDIDTFVAGLRSRGLLQQD